MDIFWTFYLNHLSPLWGYFLNIMNRVAPFCAYSPSVNWEIFNFNFVCASIDFLDLEELRGFS